MLHPKSFFPLISFNLSHVMCYQNQLNWVSSVDGTLSPMQLNSCCLNDTCKCLNDYENVSWPKACILCCLRWYMLARVTSDITLQDNRLNHILCGVAHIIACILQRTSNTKFVSIIGDSNAVTKMYKMIPKCYTDTWQIKWYNSAGFLWNKSERTFAIHVLLYD